jgi:hypothetical protein
MKPLLIADDGESEEELGLGEGLVRPGEAGGLGWSLGGNGGGGNMKPLKVENRELMGLEEVAITVPVEAGRCHVLCSYSIFKGKSICSSYHDLFSS